MANELDLLISAFPDLDDAFDADELPILVIMRRDARYARTNAVRRQKPTSAANNSGQPVNEEILGATSHGTQEIDQDRSRGAE